MGKTKTKSQKKSHAKASRVAEETYGAVPHSFVFHRGQIGKNVGQLISDVRRLMEPYTAKSLKVRKKNVLKDFVTVAGPLGVTHFVVFSKTTSSINMRLARLPKGPTLHFRVVKYSLVKDVVSALKKHRMHDQQFTHHPLLVLNNFAADGMHIKLMATMFQNMFPSINVHTVSLNNIKRCVLLDYNLESQEIEFRHYSLKVVPVGMSRGVKKLMQEKFPNMSKFDDISELLMKGANLSESEAEQDGEHNITELPQIYAGRGNMVSQQTAVRLTEIGPRMTLRLIKIQEGMGEGNVLYHATISKSEEEIQEMLKRKEAQLKEKAARRKAQEQNVVKKKEKKEAHRKKSLEGIKRKHEAEEDSEVEDPGMQQDQAAVESDDEAEYYRQAVGAEPDEGMFPGAKKRKSSEKLRGPAKKRKLSPDISRMDKSTKVPKRNDPGGRHGSKMGHGQQRKGWKKFEDRDKAFGKKFKPKGQKFRGKKQGNEKRKFGGKKKFEGKKVFLGNKSNDKSFKSTGQKNKSGFKTKGAGFKKGFKQRKGKAVCHCVALKQMFHTGNEHSHRLSLQDSVLQTCLLILGATIAESTSKMQPNVHRCEKLQVTLLPSVFGVEFCIALAGNLFAMWLLVTRERRNWHTGIVLSCNLAISDLLYVLTLPLLIVYYALEKNWLFGTAMCKMEKFLFTCNLYASTFFIMTISVNRCVALAYPFFARSHVRPAHAKAVSVLIWIIVGVISCPVLKFASICPDEHNRNKTLCVSYCGSAAENPHTTYKMFLAVFGCLVPFLVTLGSYCIVIRVVWKNTNITKLEKRQVALMVVSVVVLYVISFIPYHVFQSYHLSLRIQGIFVCWVYDMYQVSKGLATVNMCIHPILYMAVIDSMRVTCCGRSK
ncbi:suppressor of SWI4 1 homolog [Thalassophryne amazonica]|uniref:suppressor of SWI4 1 homolog n=1 Tax=Thalassophryne amazonica TaxID=390379 RepID=UPI0014725617|nr:suppressor of SWI4 1 homolog [Thalassophryne amazonica]